MKKPDDGKPNRKSHLLACGCLLSPFLLVVAGFFLTHFYNNFRLWQFDKRFSAISHPAQTRFVARTQDVGLFANGNHCDFLVAEARSFTGSRSAVLNFYKATRIAVPNAADDDFSDVKNGTQPVEIEFLPSPLPQNYRWKLGYSNALNLSFAAGRKNLYVVFIGNIGESYSWDSMCDLRCT